MKPFSSRVSNNQYETKHRSNQHVGGGGGGGRVVRWCWVNFQCRGVLQLG